MWVCSGCFETKHVSQDQGKRLEVSHTTLTKTVEVAYHRKYVRIYVVMLLKVPCVNRSVLFKRSIV